MWLDMGNMQDLFDCNVSNLTICCYFCWFVVILFVKFKLHFAMHSFEGPLTSSNVLPTGVSAQRFWINMLTSSAHFPNWDCLVWLEIALSCVFVLWERFGGESHLTSNVAHTLCLAFWTRHQAKSFWTCTEIFSNKQSVATNARIVNLARWFFNTFQRLEVLLNWNPWFCQCENFCTIWVCLRRFLQTSWSAFMDFNRPRFIDLEVANLLIQRRKRSQCSLQSNHLIGNIGNHCGMHSVTREQTTGCLAWGRKDPTNTVTNRCQGVRPPVQFGRWTIWARFVNAPTVWKNRECWVDACLQFLPFYLAVFRSLVSVSLVCHGNSSGNSSMQNIKDIFWGVDNLVYCSMLWVHMCGQVVNITCVGCIRWFCFETPGLLNIYISFSCL